MAKGLISHNFICYWITVVCMNNLHLCNILSEGLKFPPHGGIIHLFSSLFCFSFSLSHYLFFLTLKKIIRIKMSWNNFCQMKKIIKKNIIDFLIKLKYITQCAFCAYMVIKWNFILLQKNCFSFSLSLSLSFLTLKKIHLTTWILCILGNKMKLNFWVGTLEREQIINLFAVALYITAVVHTATGTMPLLFL